jgi:hypothetical protein
MKTPPAERRIYHQNDQRADSHIFLCVLAFHLLIAIEKTLLDHGRHTSWAAARDTLKTYPIGTVVLPTKIGPTLRIRKAATPEEDVAELYQLLRYPRSDDQPHPQTSADRQVGGGNLRVPHVPDRRRAPLCGVRELLPSSSVVFPWQIC